MKKAVVVSFNWDTHDILFTDFDGDDAGIKAESWAHQDSFIWRDYPASAGWTHFVHKNPECQAADVDALVNLILHGGSKTLKVPQ